MIHRGPTRGTGDTPVPFGLRVTPRLWLPGLATKAAFESAEGTALLISAPESGAPYILDTEGPSTMTIPGELSGYSMAVISRFPTRFGTLTPLG